MNTSNESYELLTNLQVDELVDISVNRLIKDPLTSELAEFKEEFIRAKSHGMQEQFLAATYASLFGLIAESVSKWGNQTPQDTKGYFVDPELPMQMIDGILSRDIDSLMNLLLPKYTQFLKENTSKPSDLSKQAFQEAFQAYSFSMLARLAALYTTDTPE